MMKLLHVIPTVALEHGGPSHGVRMMASACAKKMVVEVATTSFGTPLGREDPGRTWQYQEDGVVYRLFPRTTQARWNFSVPLTRWLLSEVARYDVLHVHAPFSYPTLAACAAARRRGVPYVYRPLGALDPWSLRHRAWKKWPYYQLLEKRNVRGASVVHVTSETERRAIDALGFGRLARVVGYGVALPPFVHRVPGRTVRVLFVGRLHPKKCLPLLLEAVAKLQAGGDAALQLDIAGGGDDAYRGELEERARQLGIEARVRFLGFVHGEAKARLFAESDVFVLPSYQENFGVAVAEAMAAGLPAIVSDGVALADEIEAAGAGIRVPVGDATSLAEALRRMLDPVARGYASEQARQLVGRRFTIEAMGSGLEAMYRSAVDDRITTTSGARDTSARAQ
jgi:glycosyltransferase involved in cell wall biosynthesis